MAVGVRAWSTTAANNASADSNINFAEGQTPASLNNSARAQMAALKAWTDALGGGVTYGGTGNAYTITNNAVGAWAAYASGDLIALKANATNTGAATVNVDGLGAKTIKTADGGDVASGDIVSGGIYILAYDGTNFQVVNTIGGGSYQPLDATLTALAALSWASGNALVQFTAADTVSLTLAPSVTSVTASGVVTSGVGSVSAPGHTFSGVTNYGFYYVTGDVGFAANGSACLSYNTSRFQSFIPIQAPDGSVSAPGLAFKDDTNNGWYRIGTDNWAGAVGGSKFVDISTSRVEYSLPLSARILDSSETGGTLTSASRNRRVVCASAPTLPASGMTAGDFVLIDPAGTARTVTRPAAHTMYVRDTDSATDDTYAHNCALAIYHGSSKWTLHGMPY